MPLYITPYYHPVFKVWLHVVTRYVNMINEMRGIGKNFST